MRRAKSCCILPAVTSSYDTTAGSLRPFEFLEPIGEGGMGKLWRARHRKQQVDVAIKFIQPHRLESNHARQMFEREARAMALLNHRSILSIYDYGELDAPVPLIGHTMRAGSPYLVMDYADGGNLRQRPFPTDWFELERILEQILDALTHAHARSLYHRDLKPENIVVKHTDDGAQLQLTDFGLAYIANVDTRTVERDLAAGGTPAYMAPEQIEADWRRVGPWTDLYSVGIIAYELASGGLPFTGDSALTVMMGHIKAPVPPLVPRFEVPVRYVDWVRRLLAKQPEYRFQTAVHALHELRELDASGLTPLPPQVADEDTDDLQHSDTLVPAGAPTRLLTVDSNTTLIYEPFSKKSADMPPLPEFPTFALPDEWRRAEAAPPAVLTGVGLGLFGVRDLGLVGREAERDAIWGSLAKVRERGEPALTMVRSPSGRGASALASWIVRRAGEIGAFEVVDLAHGTRYALEFLLGTRDLSGSEREAAIATSLEQVDRANLVRPACSVVKGTRGAHADRVLASYLEARSQSRPIAVLIDDAHDELASLTLIRNLLDRRGPIAVVAVVREDDLADDPVANEIVYHLGRHERSTTVEVSPMDDDDLRSMVRRLIPLDPADLEGVVEHAQGNPRVATELLREWVSRGILVPEGHAYVLAEGRKLSVPERMIDPWQKRFDAFVNTYDDSERGDVRRALEFGACLGATVKRADWDHAIALANIETDKFFLNETADAKLLEGDMKLGRITHPMLRHAVLRTTAHEGRLESVHHVCERTYAQSYPPEHLGARLRRIEHLHGAGKPATALDLALDVLREVGEHDEVLAIRAANRGMDAAMALELERTDPRRYELEARLALTMRELDPVRANARIDRLLDLAEQVTAELRALVLYAGGCIKSSHRQQHEAVRLLGESIETYATLGDPAGEAKARERRAKVEIGKASN
jgi:serine/threonine protein kinase